MKLKGILITIILIFVAFAAGSFYKVNSGSNNSSDNVTVTTTVELTFDDIAELATEEYHITNVGQYTSDYLKAFGLNIPFTQKRFMLKYKAVVKAGIKDISGISYYRKDEAQKYVIVCPDVTVFEEPAIYQDSIEVYDEKDGLFNKVSISDMADFEAGEESKVREIAINDGLIQKAENRAKNLLIEHAKAILSQTEYKDYSVEVVFNAA